MVIAIFQEQLKIDTEKLVTQVEEHQQKLQERELELATAKQALNAKINEVNLHEASLEDKTSVIHSLSKELQSMKSKIETLRQEKTKLEVENKKKILETNELKAKIEQLKSTVKKNESNVNEIKQKVRTNR
jgi:chromosome segregation ATPase